MDTGYIALVTIISSILFIVHQRTETTKRRATQFVIILTGIGLIFNANLKSLFGETIAGVLLGLMVAFLFWLLVGRYNPVGSSDENIKVYGMDD